MNNIETLIQQKENRKLEFKRELPSNDKIIKIAISFSNSQGGDLIIGVTDSNELVGIDENEVVKFEEIISNTIYDNCLPNIIPEIYSVRIEAKTVLVVHFYPSNNKPHYIKKDGKHKGTFVRVGSSNRLATLEIIEDLERQKRRISFDSVINYDLEYRDGIFSNLDRHIEAKLDKTPSLEVYEKLKLVKSERDAYFLTNLGVLFSPNRDDYFPLVKIECARFKGTTTKVFLDQATFNGDIIESIEKTIEFIKRNIRLGATIGEVYRENRWEYPLLALREMVINAVVHRDYSILGSDIKIAIFDDMIEITSPGVLMIDKEKVGRGYSELRNQNLGNLFKLFDIIEQSGTGFEKLAEELENYLEINFEIDDSSSFTQMRFIKIETSLTTQETTQETFKQKSTKDKIIEALRQDGSLTREDLAQKVGVSDNAVKQHLANLKKDNIIKRVGSTKSGHWEIIK